MSRKEYRFVLLLVLYKAWNCANLFIYCLIQMNLRKQHGHVALP